VADPTFGEPVQERRLLAPFLATTPGYVDAAGYLSLRLFTAHMSGNSARLGVYLGTGLFLRAAPSAFAIIVFVLSIGAGTLVVEYAAGRAGSQ
jgi:uncharacterized membrane protein YoaK (UPF0700 family)